MSVTTPSLGDSLAARTLTERHRLRWWEPLPWLLALAFYFAFPRYLGFGTEVLITILFAIALDLALGYAGIVTLGHAAFFGAGAYTVGMLAKNGIWTEPITGLIAAAVVAGVIGPATDGSILKVMLPPTAELHVSATVPVAVTAGVSEAALAPPAKALTTATATAIYTIRIFFIICCRLRIRRFFC